MTDRRSIGYALIGCALLAGCETPAPAPGSAPPKFDIHAAPGLEGLPNEEALVWMAAYGFGRGVAYMALHETRKNPSGDDFAIELFARKELAESWREQRANGVAADEYLDRLVALSDQGRLEEHVLGSLAKPGWTLSAGDLSSLDFTALAELARDPIAAPTYAIAIPHSGPLWSAVPGATLPDPGTLAPPTADCIQSMPTLRRAMTAWKQEAEQLDGAPIAAEDRTGFLAAIASLPAHAPQRADGATWVDPRAYWLSFLAGFCSVELERIGDAERWLAQAVAMAPRHPTARMELTHVLIGQRKFDRADAVLDDVISSESERCVLGTAWRKRGYIRFEQRRLDEAHAAYLRSLEFDPGSELARSELALLRGEIGQHGDHPDWYVPPPSTPDQVSLCK